MINKIIHELEHHAPFTMLGALLGILGMVIFYKLPHETAYGLFYVFHPLHVLLSAIVIASMYKLHSEKAKRSFHINILSMVAIAYAGSVGISTLSDSLIPYLGEILMKMPNKGIHLGFVEKWWFINSAVFIGILIAYVKPSTKMPHAGHIFISTLASLLHIFMAKGEVTGILTYLGIFFFLFLAVWLPCCVSDIAFPLVFTSDKK